MRTSNLIQSLICLHEASSNKTRSGIAFGRGVEHVNKDSSPQILRQIDAQLMGILSTKKLPGSLLESLHHKGLDGIFDTNLHPFTVSLIS